MCHVEELNVEQMYEKKTCPAPASGLFLLAGGTFLCLSCDEFLSVAEINLTRCGFTDANTLQIEQ